MWNNYPGNQRGYPPPQGPPPGGAPGFPQAPYVASPLSFDIILIYPQRWIPLAVTISHEYMQAVDLLTALTATSLEEEVVDIVRDICLGTFISVI